MQCANPQPAVLPTGQLAAEEPGSMEAVHGTLGSPTDSSQHNDATAFDLPDLGPYTRVHCFSVRAVNTSV